jgi:hypothetical protein
MNDLTVLVVPYDLSDQVLVDIHELLINFCAISEHVTPEDICRHIKRAQWDLFVAVDNNNDIKGYCTVAYTETAKAKIAYINSISGKGIVNKELFNQLKKILKALGVNVIRGYADESRVRLYRKLGVTPTKYIELGVMI